MDAGDGHLRDNGGDTPLWGRQAGESGKAFEAVALYRDLRPSRSLAKVGEGFGKSRALLERWSSTWSWAARASGWDDQADENQRERDLVKCQEARARMLAAHARGGGELHAIGCRVLKRFDTSNPDTADDARARIEKLSALDAARRMEIGAHSERLARDDASERVTDARALKFVETLVDLALGYLPHDRNEAFLTDVEAVVGTGRGL